METALENSIWVISPEFAGHLQKKGFFWRKLWKKRWVALHGSEIAYMAEEPNDFNSQKLVITKAQITSATLVDREDVDGHPHGFAIHINDGTSPTWYLRAESTREKKSWLMRLGHVHTIVRWLEEFEKVRVMGVGGTGIVYELLHKSNGQRYAMKEMEIKNKAQMQMAVGEAEMLKEIMENISHPNIMHIEKVFQVGNKFYLVFPLMTGGELYEHVIRKGHFSEYDAAVLMRDLISALHELHSNDILHLDIKPENILFDTDAEDARVKITDFGLSKVYNQEHKTSLDPKKRNPTMEELDKSLKSFQESGVLNRDRLRGTVGYMSPELILAGHSSTATDVWAAGVVLYILLCGRPPFQSRSNREILEKSAKGEYSMEGKDWAEVSAEAKDLVSRMLTVDPDARITCPDILAHPWIKIGIEEEEARKAAAASQSDKNSVGSGRGDKRSAANLQAAMRALSGHVNDRKMEKMMTNFGRLVSSLQQGKTDGHRLVKLLGLEEGESEVLQGSGTVMTMEVRDALMHAFRLVGGEDNNGKITVEQFCQLLSHFGYGGESGVSTSGALLLICRFIDSDGDGLISSEDLFLAEARIMQRSPQFLRAVFRIYSESIWYPGRALNIVSIKSNMSSSSSRQSKAAIIESEESNSDFIEPPKYITSKHVAAVFERLGYEPLAGIKLFGALCEALARRRTQRKESGSDITDDSSESLSSPRDTPVVTPPAPSPKKAVGGRNAALTALVGNLADSVSTAVTSIGISVGAGVDSSNTESTESGRSGGESVLASPGVKGKGLDVGTDEKVEDIVARSESYKMDVQDFIDAVEIDDVLIQVIQLKPRTRLMKVMKATMDGANNDNTDNKNTSTNQSVNDPQGNQDVTELGESLMGQRFSTMITDALSSKQSPRSRSSSAAGLE